MIIGEVTKTASESVARSINFTNRLATGETATLVSVVVTRIPTGEDVTATLIDAAPGPAITGGTVSFIIIGGVSGESYMIAATISTSGREVLEDHLQLLIN